MSHLYDNGKQQQRGQSLVEVALFLPILIIVLAGVVEVSNLVITQNRVSTAARIAARFAANGGSDEGMWVVALNSVTQTLELNETDWDLWSIRATVDDNGTGFSEWQFEHIYGISNTVQYSTISETVIMDEVLAQLRVNEDGGNVSTGQIAGMRVVGTFVLHDVHSILGLDAIPNLIGMNTIRGLNVMRQVGLANLEPTDGCDAFPIAIEEGIRSVNGPPNASVPGSYPLANTFDNDNPPTYYDFPYHVDDKPLLEAKEGYVYYIFDGFGAGNFGWLNWNEYVSANAQTLEDALIWPGNSKDYTTVIPGGPPPGWPHRFPGFLEYGDPTDSAMHIGDRVHANTGLSNASGVREQLDNHIDGNRILRLIIWRYEEDGFGGTGNQAWYRIVRFGLFRLQGYKVTNSGPGSWILAEFIRWDDSCGQVIPGP
jgi:hypothetical protein